MAVDTQYRIDAIELACLRMKRQAPVQLRNGRAMRTLWERTREAQASRVMRHPTRTPEMLATIEPVDIERAMARGESVLASGRDWLLRLKEALPLAWKHDQVFQYPVVVGGATLAMLVLRAAK